MVNKTHITGYAVFLIVYSAITIALMIKKLFFKSSKQNIRISIRGEKKGAGVEES